MENQINLNTFPKLNILIDLSYLKHFEGTWSEFEKLVGLSKGNPESREIFKVLKEKGIVTPTRMKYQFQLYEINIKKLCEIIESQLFIQKVDKYLDFLH